jgi:hypothetical protein
LTLKNQMQDGRFCIVDTLKGPKAAQGLQRICTFFNSFMSKYATVLILRAALKAAIPTTWPTHEMEFCLHLPCLAFPNSRR